jgi:prepilin-type N-terminal cleavage/methylation domain-containing protein
LRSATLARCATGHDRPESPVTIAGIRSNDKGELATFMVPNPEYIHRPTTQHSKVTQEGFTLIECVMVIVILGVLAAVARPKF